MDSSNFQQGEREAQFTRSRALLFCGVIAGPLFMLALLLQDFTTANFHPLRHPGSSLALGPLGWVQDVNFIVAGLLTLAFAVGLWQVLRSPNGSTWGPLLVGYWAIGLIGAGIFPTDPVLGFPPGTPDLVVTPSLHGALHDLFSVPAFLCMVIACCFVFRRWFAQRKAWAWAIYSVINGVVLAVSFALAGAGFALAPGLVNLGGLFERIAALAIWSWLLMIALYFLRRIPKERL
jgi:hypothetical membrane protein